MDERIDFERGVEVMRQARDVPKEQEVSKGIVVSPHRCGGQPTIKGTRVTASMIASLMEGEDPAGLANWIIESYPHLTPIDIANVRGWDRKGRPHE